MHTYTINSEEPIFLIHNLSLNWAITDSFFCLFVYFFAQQCVTFYDPIFVPSGFERLAGELFRFCRELTYALVTVAHHNSSMFYFCHIKHFKRNIVTLI